MEVKLNLEMFQFLLTLATFVPETVLLALVATEFPMDNN